MIRTGIALVDLALRRRFAFVDFSVNEEPVKGLLRRWLDAQGLGKMEWVADAMERANANLDDHHAAIGPSYFMRPGLDDAAVERVWKHNVLPYIEEHLFGERDLACFPHGAGIVVGERPGVRDTSPVEFPEDVWRPKYLRAAQRMSRKGREDHPTGDRLRAPAVRSYVGVAREALAVGE